MATRYRRVLEINGKEKISIPIVKFPPFHLRAAMVEKDPVIWLHLLEVYVSHMKYLLRDDNLDFIDEQTVDYLCIFVRSYLHEMSSEEGKLLSLGMNADVLKQLQILRAYVFEIIKRCGPLFLHMSTETLWDLVRAYVLRNVNSVRSLIDGSLTPSINAQKAQINRIYQVQQHVIQLIEANRFSRVDLKCLEHILADSSDKKAFTDQFVSNKWVDTLESMYSKDAGSYISEWGKKLGLLSYLSCTVSHLSNLLKELSISNLQTLAMYPLLGSILIDEKFQSKVPSLRTKIPFLFSIKAAQKEVPFEVTTMTTSIDSSQIPVIQELFPDLSVDQVKELLLQYDNKSELIINNLFEDPSIIDTLNCTSKVPSSSNLQPPSPQLPVISPKDKIEKTNLSFPVNDVPDAVRNQTLTRALSLLYDPTEDERDDTYDEAEVKHNSTGRIAVDASEGIKESDNKSVNRYDKLEGYLWELLKGDKSLFTRERRGSKQRKDMKKETSWSDEQIEGWARMIEKSPRRAQLLEEKYIFKGNVRQGKRAVSSQRNGPQEAHVEMGSSVEDAEENGSKNTDQLVEQKPHDSKSSQRKRNARNEKHKATRANHNRKAGYARKIGKASAD